jgi:hypothetical protein
MALLRIEPQKFDGHDVAIHPMPHRSLLLGDKHRDRNFCSAMLANL